MQHLDNYSGPSPSATTESALLRRAGQTPQGFPIYRLVRSEFVKEKRGGSWNIWDENLSADDRGGIVTGPNGQPMQNPHRPDKVVVDVIETQRYSHVDTHGWVLERWFPAVLFGSPEEWYERTVEGSNVPMFGPYPHQGDYIGIYGPVENEPSQGFLEDFILAWEERRASFPADVEEHMKMRTDAAIQDERVRRDRAIKDNVHRLKDSVAPLESTTLEAGRWRSKQFERAGFTSHFGN